ncbi:MAG: methionyl-tRNA formyltransferase [Candidatus Alcyoniella australis]|nr:methionyl-tRNA formyltransferase [Candidatus Alcyoniella australis]
MKTNRPALPGMQTQPWKIVFFGTDAVSRVVLDALFEGPDRVVACVSQPDRPAGRGRNLHPTQVKIVAQTKGLPLRQPERMRDPELVQWLQSFNAELFVVAAFGRILKPELLQIPLHGCLNVHTSLLPKYRGAAPIQWAVANGEQVSGATIMLMDQGMDTGPLLLQRELAIGPHETAQQLTVRLAALGAALLPEAIKGLKAGTLEPVPQEESLSSAAPILRKSDGLIDWSLNAALIASRLRGFTPWPGCYTYLDGKLLKVIEACAESDCDPAQPGTVLKSEASGLLVACGRGCLRITRLQLEGRKPLECCTFLSGCHVDPGTELGD